MGSDGDDRFLSGLGVGRFVLIDVFKMWHGGFLSAEIEGEKPMGQQDKRWWEWNGPRYGLALKGGRTHDQSMDKLEEIFSMQAALNRRIGVELEGLSEAEKTRWVLNYTRAMQQELAELVDSVPWKWWAKYQEFDEQNARVEVVDLFHFLVSLAQVLGMSAEDVYGAYVKKNQVNHARQESGYVKKDEADSRHI